MPIRLWPLFMKLCAYEVKSVISGNARAPYININHGDEYDEHMVTSYNVGALLKHLPDGK